MTCGPHETQIKISRATSTKHFEICAKNQCILKDKQYNLIFSLKSSFPPASRAAMDPLAERMFDTPELESLLI